MRLRPLLWAALGIALPGTSLGQVDLPPAVACVSWTTEQGLPQNTVTGIAEDAEGYLWVATYGGLARFDGARFEAYDAGSREDLSVSRFDKLYAARDGSLWIGTEGHGVLRYRDDRFESYELPTPVTSITETAEGQIIATAHGGLHRLIDGTFERAGVGHAYGLVATRDGPVFAARGPGLSRFEGDTMTDLLEEYGLAPEIYWAAHEDEQGRLWLAADRGLLRSDDARKTFFRLIEGSPRRVRAIVADTENTVWVAGFEGLVRWDPEHDTGMLLSQEHIDCLFADTRGNLWVGTSGKGLRCYRPSPLQSANAALGLSAQDVWSVSGDGAGGIHVGASGSVVSARDGALETRTVQGSLGTLLTDSSGTLWVGSGTGVLRVDTQGERFQELDPRGEGAPKVLMESSDGSLWLGTERGLFRRAPSPGETGRFQRVELSVPDVFCMLETSPGELWLGTSLGLARLEAGALSWLTSDDGLSPGVVRALHADDTGVLWAGTYGGGLSRIEDGIITRLSRHDGLVDDFLSCILEDDDGRLWIHSNRGPFVVRRADLERVARGEARRVDCIAFRHEEGAREANGGRQPSGWRGPDGRMWFPTIEGVTVADPDRLPIDEAPPRVLIESLELHAGRQLDVRFTALGFSSPDRVKLQYRLLGEDPEWIEVRGERSAHYSYLRPGTRHFQVRARNGFGPWSPVTEQPVEVPARLHETAAFAVSVVLGACLLSFGLARVQVKRLRARTALLTRLVEERESAQQSLGQSQDALHRLSRALLSAQDEERRRISSELHDDMTQRLAALAIQAELVEARLDGDPRRSRDRLLDVIAMAQQLASDVQALSRRLHPTGLRTLGLSRAVRQECEAFTRRGGVRVDVEEDVAVDEIPPNTATAAFRILQESLHNIEKHAQASAVRVSIRRSGDQLVVSIEDRGRGFAGESKGQAGLGLITMRERAATLGGHLSVTSRPGQGTTVELRAPIPTLEART